MHRYLLNLEFPINEGYIWVEIRDDTISSAPVAMCIECGDIGYCDTQNCIGCEYEKPEMIARKERIDAIYTKLSPWIDDIAIEMKKRFEEKLKEIEG